MTMKKIISMVICACVLLTSAVFVASANVAQSDTESTPTTNTKSKISDELAKIIAEGKDDIVPVYIFLKDCDINTSEIEIYVLENYEGADTDADIFLKYYREEVARIIGAYVQQFVDDNKKLLEKIIFQTDSAEVLIADVKIKNIEKLSQISIVNNISYFHNTVDKVDDGTLYEEKFLEWTEKTHGKNSLTDGYRYTELYHHKDSNGNTDWVLVDACYLLPVPEPVVSMTIGGRYILSGAIYSPFKCCYGIYDVNEDTFYDMYDFQDNPERFSGLVDALNELNIGTVVEEPTTEAVQPTTSATEPTKSVTPTEDKAKKANKMKVTVKDKKVKAKTLKTAKVTVKAITVKKANGTVSYKKVAKKSSNRLTVNKKTGKITVKKGTKKGNYKIKVKITALGTKNYKPKTVTKTIKIKVQ